MKINWDEAVGYGLIMCASCFWGGAASLGKHLFQSGISTAELMQIRSVISALILIPMLAVFGRKHLRIQASDLWPLLLLSLPGLVLVNASYYYAVRLLPIAIAVFIQFTAPVLVFLYGWMTGKEQATWKKFAALLLGLSGTYFMVQLQQSSMKQLPWIGILSAVVSMLSYAFYLIVSHSLGKKHTPWTIVAYCYGIASLFWILVQNVVTTAHKLTELNLWIYGLLFAFCSTLIPFVIFLTGLRRVTPTGAAIASTTETITASLFAFIFLGETLTFWQIAGAGMILTAIILLVYNEKYVPAADEPNELTL